MFLGEGPDGPVAVKRLHLQASDAAHRELAVAEELMDRDLEWVIPVFDAGQDAHSDSYFIVMAKAEGSLEGHLTQGAVDEVEAIGILQSIALGLREVDNLVHRDLKPGNVLSH